MEGGVVSIVSFSDFKADESVNPESDFLVGASLTGTCSECLVSITSGFSGLIDFFLQQPDRKTNMRIKNARWVGALQFSGTIR